MKLISRFRSEYTDYDPDYDLAPADRVAALASTLSRTLRVTNFMALISRMQRSPPNSSWGAAVAILRSLAEESATKTPFLPRLVQSDHRNRHNVQDILIRLQGDIGDSTLRVGRRNNRDGIVESPTYPVSSIAGCIRIQEPPSPAALSLSSRTVTTGSCGVSEAAQTASILEDTISVIQLW
jgi:hypothetical protein